MMAATGRVRAVEMERDGLGARPTPQHPCRARAHELLQRPEIPFQNSNFARRVGFCQTQEKLSQCFGLRAAAPFQAYPGVEIPAQYEDTLLRLFHHLVNQVIIVCRIDHYAGALGPRDPPAILPFDDYRLQRIIGSMSGVALFHPVRSLAMPDLLTGQSFFVSACTEK